MKEIERTHGTCPKCGKPIIGHPALSRTDNYTRICSDCGTREALDSLGICDAEQEQIIQAIHRSLEPET